MNNREEQIEKASVEYQLNKRPMAIGGDVFADEVYRMNINPSFIAGAEWADEHPNEQMIAKYLFEKKGYPIDLNGNLPSFEDINEEKVDNANKVVIKPKFKPGDWITNGKCTWKIEFIEDGLYYQIYSYLECGGDIESIDKEYHLWTIADAKDGDVLCGYPDTAYPWIGIFHKLNTEDTFNSYCYLQAGQHGKFYPPSGKNIFGKRNIDNHSSNNVVPATKEQRDILFQKMKEAGYEWDAEKKELKKIEQKQDPCEHCNNICLNCHNFPCINKRAFEQNKSVWEIINEENDDNVNKVTKI